MDRETELAELNSKMRHHYSRSMQCLAAMTGLVGLSMWMTHRVPPDDWGALHLSFIAVLWLAILVSSFCCGWHIGQELRLERRREELDDYVP